MPRTLTSGQEAERIKDGVKGVWLVVSEFDQADPYSLGVTTKRYASRQYTISSNQYEGIIADGGIDLGFLRIKEQGGLGPVATTSLRIRDESRESTITDTHVISNDEVFVYFVFPTGSEVDADRIEIFRGVIERNNTRNNIWSLRLKDDSKTQIKFIPTILLDPIRFPFASSLGAVMPEAFGNLNNTPDNLNASDRVSLAPARVTDKFGLKAVASENQKSATNYVYQFYQQAEIFAQIVNATISNGEISFADPARIGYARPSRTFTGNGYTNWYNTIEPNTTEFVTLDSSNDLRVVFGGLPQIGIMTAVKLTIKSSTGVYAWYLYDSSVSDVTPIASNATASGDVLQALTLADYQDFTSLGDLHIKISPRSPFPTTKIEEVSVKLEFDDLVTQTDQEPQIFQTIQGFEDQTAHYNDGAVVTSAGTVLRNPVHILEALLRAKNLNNLKEAQIDATSFATAATSRNDWYFDFFLREQVSDQFLDQFCFEAGLFLYSTEGKWHCSAMDVNRTPEHFFHGNYNMAVSGSVDNPMEQQYDLEVTPSDSSDIFNEISIRHSVHPATNQPQKASIASGQFRITGEAASLYSSTSTLEDFQATFVTDNVVAGERVYVVNDQLYEVVSVTSETVIVITPVEGGAVSDLGLLANYFLGPNINDLAYISQRAYKSVNALGGNRQKTFLDDGGFISNLIRDDSTADKLRDHCLDWFSQPRDKFKFSLMHDGILVMPGDFLYLDHPNFKATQKAQTISATTEAVDATETEIDITANTAELFRANDYIYLQENDTTAPEVMKVASVDATNNRLTVVRGQCNTQATTFTTGKSINRLIQKFVCTGVKMFDPNDTRIQIEAQMAPFAYKPIGRVVADDYPNYLSATDEQRMQAGFVTFNSGRAQEYNPLSAISYVG